MKGSTFGKLPLLLELQIYNNRFSGPLPTELGSLVLLSLLYADGNLLSGSIPDLGGLKWLESLYLFGNFLAGTIPTTVAATENMKHLRLNRNFLSGTIPSEIGLATNLRTIYLNNNTHLTGNIPNMHALSNLEKARMHGNKFYGSMTDTGLCPKPLPLIELTSDCNSIMSCSCCDQCF